MSGINKIAPPDASKLKGPLHLWWGPSGWHVISDARGRAWRPAWSLPTDPYCKLETALHAFWRFLGAA